MSRAGASQQTHNSAFGRWRQALWQRWLNRRIPPASVLALSHRNVFILPSRTGWVFALLLLVMLLTAINYQNSLIYGLTFWLLSIGLTSMWLTFRNLSGLTLSAGQAQPVFCGETLQLPVQLTSKHWSAGLLLVYPGNQGSEISVSPGATVNLTVPLRTHQRGHLPVRRLRIQSRYPFGLYTAWSWIALEYRVLVYPQPVSSPLQLTGAEDGADQEQSAPQLQENGDEPDGLRDYRPGDSLRRIAWKQSARTGELRTLEMSSESGPSCWLDWDAFSGIETEQRLSRLTAWVEEAAAQDWRYGLRLPGQIINPGEGEQQRRECLKALALWGAA